MKNKTVYMCNNGHLHYGDIQPEKCKYCGETNFGLITSSMEGYSVSEESRDDNN
jgi:hypothetical protein